MADRGRPWQKKPYFLVNKNTHRALVASPIVLPDSVASNTAIAFP
jgi:hypothetical protein